MGADGVSLVFELGSVIDHGHGHLEKLLLRAYMTGVCNVAVMME